MNNLSPKAIRLALHIWEEQIASGIGMPDEVAKLHKIDEWLDNRTYPFQLLNDAAEGDVSALAEVRLEAGLDILI